MPISNQKEIMSVVAPPNKPDEASPERPAAHHER